MNWLRRALEAEDHYRQLVCESTASYLAKTFNLTKKEHRLLAYMLNDNNSFIIGDICKALKTTVRTLIAKTKPGLYEKLGKPGSGVWEKNIQDALESGTMPQLVDCRIVAFDRTT